MTLRRTLKRRERRKRSKERWEQYRNKPDTTVRQVSSIVAKAYESVARDLDRQIFSTQPFYTEMKGLRDLLK